MTGKDEAAKKFILSHIDKLNESASSQLNAYSSRYAPRLLTFLETGEVPSRDATIPSYHHLTSSTLAKQAKKKAYQRRPIACYRARFDHHWKKYANLLLSHLSPAESLQPGLQYELRNAGSADALCRIFVTVRWPKLEEIISHYYSEIDNGVTIRIEASALLGFKLSSVCHCDSEASIEEYLSSAFKILNEQMLFSSLL